MNWDNVEFKNEKRFLSNMYLANIKLNIAIEDMKPIRGVMEILKQYDIDVLNGDEYKSTEHAYQAFKTDNEEWVKLVKETDDPHKIKSLSRRLITKNGENNTYKLRDKWDKIRFPLMLVLVYIKFLQNINLRNKLTSLYGKIEERNDWRDKYWGTYNGEGQNNLGKILMHIRDYFWTDYERKKNVVYELNELYNKLDIFNQLNTDVLNSDENSKTKELKAAIEVEIEEKENEIVTIILKENECGM